MSHDPKESVLDDDEKEDVEDEEESEYMEYVTNISPSDEFSAPIFLSLREIILGPDRYRVDNIYPDPFAAVALSAFEELIALRFKVDIAEAENASLRARIKTIEAVEKVTRNHKRLARIGIEQQLAAVQESHRQDREDFRKLKELVTSQFEQRS
ncbi:hypothetical protein Tco_0927451 [Tanacetum coccineum]